ncbi:nuclear transport factor 2 family protein [Rhodopseudomonas telluris]|uniref:Nuclear transport factor 2 family protein n=1 Tax=Rhodopseudomonas telluris TaxID=644215 RepID=A0ABV6EWL7_9BRAD
MLTKDAVVAWLEQLKAAWTTKDVEGALRLFEATERYYERPFHAGTTQSEYRSYWQDIVNLEDITFDFEVVAVDGNTACVHWRNDFRTPGDGKSCHLDGVFVIKFDSSLRCIEFRQWWFMA